MWLRAGVESRFDCHRISVKQEDFEKSLQPDTWPVGVRVRPWVHYPARNLQARPGGQNIEGAGNVGHVVSVGHGQTA